MVAPVIPLIYWGMGILLAGGATVALRNLQEEEKLRRGQIDLPAPFADDQMPEMEPDNDNRSPQRPNNSQLRAGMEAMIASETKRREDCDDTEQQDCPYCKPAVEGMSVWDNFDGGPVRKPYPKARGSLYQHYVVPWFQYIATETNGDLYIQLEEWSWRRNGNWDGLDHTDCKLYECKLGYYDFLDESRLNHRDSYTFSNPQKPWLGNLYDAFEGRKGQLSSQYNAFSDEWPHTTLQWVFSDYEVMWQFTKMRDRIGMTKIDNRHIPYDLAPSGTQFVREMYASGDEDYGYWEDT